MGIQSFHHLQAIVLRTLENEHVREPQLMSTLGMDVRSIAREASPRQRLRCVPGMFSS